MSHRAGWAWKDWDQLLSELYQQGILAVLHDGERWYLVERLTGASALPWPIGKELDSLPEGDPIPLTRELMWRWSSVLAALGWPDAWMTVRRIHRYRVGLVGRCSLQSMSLEQLYELGAQLPILWLERQRMLASAMVAAVHRVNQLGYSADSFEYLVAEAVGALCEELGLEPVIRWVRSENGPAYPQEGIQLKVSNVRRPDTWLYVDLGSKALDLRRALTDVVGYCGSFWAHAQRFRELEQHSRGLAALVEVDNALVGIESLDDLSEKVCRILAEVLGAKRVRFQQLHAGAAVGVGGREGLAQRLEMPVVVRGRLAGRLQIEKAGGGFSRHEIALCQVVAGRVAAAMERQVLFRQVARGKREWEQTFDAIGDAIFLLDSEGTVIRANKAFARLYGVQPHLVVGSRITELCNRIGCLADRLGGGKGEAGGCHLSLRLTGLTAGESAEVALGKSVFELSKYPLDLPDGQAGFVAIMKDITEQRSLQEAVIRSEKLRVLGEMASGIAHDFNNLLSTVLGRTEMLLMSSLESRFKEEIRAIQQAALDGREMVKRIQEYTWIRRDSQFRTVDVNDVVQVAVDLAKPRWRDAAYARGVKINVNLDLKPVPMVMGSASDLREVILNLIFNAIDAMPSGGDLHLSTRHDGRKVYVAVRDTGVGMTEEVIRHIFDPFFTTKGLGGSGLGLSIAWGIVTRHGGEILVESQPKRGSTFTVVLPAMSLPVTVEDEEQASPALPPKKILLVDENTAVADATAGLLTKAGHTVTVAYSGREALRRFGEEEFDLVLSDLGMPEMDGWEVARAVKALRPWVPVILATGWAFEIDESTARAEGVDFVLRKPFRLEELLRAIASVTVPARQPVGEPSASSGRHVLVVDDDVAVGEALATILGLEGLQTRVVHGYQEALEALTEFRPSVVFLDKVLADGDGLELAARLRDALPSVKIVLMSGYAVMPDDPQLLGGHVDHVLPKPWSLEELETMLATLFGNPNQRTFVAGLSSQEQG